MIEYFEKNKTNIIEKIEKNMEKYKDKLSVRIGIYNIYETIDYQYFLTKI